MNVLNRMILEDYKKNRDSFLKLEQVVDEMLQNIVKLSGIKEIMGIEHRVKSEQSLAGKLERRGDYYHRFEELTDILGARIICYFSDEVDMLGKLVEKSFLIDWENSTDKRAQMQVDSFGYLSLHYICSLPEDGSYPTELCGKKFEIQIRTVLQHAWAAIEHDIGYKSDFGVPRVITREFSRLAGLFELADDEFVRLRDNMNRYTEDIRRKIIDNEAEDVRIDIVSIREYVFHNRKMQEFIAEIAEVAGADIDNVNPNGYIEQLQFLGKTTIGDLQTMMTENRDLAFKLAERTLAGVELDLVSSSVGLRFLCRAELLNKSYSKEQILDFITLTVKNPKSAGRQMEHLLKVYEECKGE